MKNKAHDLRTYRFTPGEKILIDANVWLYLYPPPMNANVPFAWQYSQAFNQMTNDGDFQTGGIDVLTSNPRLLRSCN
jgi:hypothetical protein